MSVAPKPTISISTLFPEVWSRVTKSDVSQIAHLSTSPVINRMYRTGEVEAIPAVNQLTLYLWQTEWDTIADLVRQMEGVPMSVNARGDQVCWKVGEETLHVILLEQSEDEYPAEELLSSLAPSHAQMGVTNDGTVVETTTAAISAITKTSVYPSGAEMEPVYPGWTQIQHPDMRPTPPTLTPSSEMILVENEWMTFGSLGSLVEMVKGRMFDVLSEMVSDSVPKRETSVTCSDCSINTNQPVSSRGLVYCEYCLWDEKRYLTATPYSETLWKWNMTTPGYLTIYSPHQPPVTLPCTNTPTSLECDVPSLEKAFPGTKAVPVGENILLQWGNTVLYIPSTGTGMIEKPTTSFQFVRETEWDCDTESSSSESEYLSPKCAKKKNPAKKSYKRDWSSSSESESSEYLPAKCAKKKKVCKRDWSCSSEESSECPPPKCVKKIYKRVLPNPSESETSTSE